MSATPLLPAKPDAQAQAASVVGKRVLVCGGRNYTDRQRVRGVLDFVEHLGDAPLVIIHGGAGGADRYAGGWATLRLRECIVYQADWKTHGKAAGPLRNQRMLVEGKPDLVVVFEGGRGTADMVRRAKAAGVEIMFIPPAA